MENSALYLSQLSYCNKITVPQLLKEAENQCYCIASRYNIQLTKKECKSIIMRELNYPVLPCLWEKILGKIGSNAQFFKEIKNIPFIVEQRI